MPTLRRDEAVARAALIEPGHAHLELTLDPDLDTFVSTTTLRFGCRQPGSASFIEVLGKSVVLAELNGVPLDVSTIADGRLPLLGLAEDNELVITAVMAYSNDGEGLHKHRDPADGRLYLYAMSFLDAGPRWFSAFDQPDLKFTWEMTVTTPDDWTVLGNGPFIEAEPGAWRMESTAPLSTYFVTLVAGPYASVWDEHDGIRLGVHARASLAEELGREADDILEVTKQGFDAYHELFGVRYPFGEYHQCFVPDFNAGAMENPGCVTFRDQFIFRGAVTESERAQRASTIAHEMAHQWFGDLVTMRWWDDLWLNESFAELLAQLVCDRYTKYPMWVDFGINRKDWGAQADQGPSTHPVAGNGAQDAASALAQFDGISYAKGAGVLKQLAATIGEEVFLNGLKDYFDRYAFGNADFSELVDCWTRAGAVDLPAWCDLWLATSGMDTLTATRHDGRPVVEARSGTPGVTRQHAVTAAAFDADGRETGRQQITVNGEPVTLDIDGDLIVADACDDSWTRLRFDLAAEQWPPLAEIEDPLVRVVLYNALRDQVRSAEVDPQVALDLLCEQLPGEPEDLIVRTMLRWAIEALCGPYCLLAQRPGRVQQVSDLCRRILAEAPAGSDRQLVAWRALLDCSTDEAELRGWLAGENLPAGRELDLELRWMLVVRLASVFGDRQVISDALDADQSASGRVHAACALAALPDRQSKEQAFELLLRPSDASAYELYATAEGFFQPHQVELTEPFVRQFFAGIGETASFRKGWSLSKLVTQAFPASANTRETLELAHRTLSQTDLDPAVRRSLTDATHRLVQAVTAVEKYAG